MRKSKKYFMRVINSCEVAFGGSEQGYREGKNQPDAEGLLFHNGEVVAAGLFVLVARRPALQRHFIIAIRQEFGEEPQDEVAASRLQVVPAPDLFAVGGQELSAKAAVVVVLFQLEFELNGIRALRNDQRFRLFPVAADAAGREDEREDGRQQRRGRARLPGVRSEEHTSELQSPYVTS